MSVITWKKPGSEVRGALLRRGDCAPVFEPGQEARKAALLEICAGLGIATDGL